jgi:signal transduction histidine kinase
MGDFKVTAYRSAATPSAMVAHLESLSERSRAFFARQLHDDIGGLLVPALMDMTWTDAHLPIAPAVHFQRLTRARESLTRAVDRGRELVDALRPTLLDDVGLFAALGWHGRHLRYP